MISLLCKAIISFPIVGTRATIPVSAGLAWLHCVFVRLLSVEILEKIPQLFGVVEHGRVIFSKNITVFKAFLNRFKVTFH